MVFVKVRETYDLATVRNKMTVIGVHTPHPDILKKNFPGLLMQCKAYRPYSCDVRIACASVLPSDPLGVGLAEGDIAPEDMFNPILYSAMSNFGMSQLEARINYMRQAGTQADVVGTSAQVDVDTVTSASDEFPIYYGLLSNAHGWKHANPQSGLEMNNLVPLVYEIVYNIGDTYGNAQGINLLSYSAPNPDGSMATASATGIRGNAKRMPMINCTAYTGSPNSDNPPVQPGFSYGSGVPGNASQVVPWIPVMVSAIIIPPSRLHQLFYRMVIEWTIEFSGIRPIGEITTFNGLADLGNTTHYQNYSYEATKEAVTGTRDSIMDSDQAMVSANVEITKVM